MNEKVKILIVDDDPAQRKTLSDILDVKGWLPLAAASGREALEIIAEERPDAALIDIRLEDISGLDVMKEIKARSPDTECILITGHASRESAIEAINLGAYSYFPKPYDMDQLLLTIRRAVEKRKTEARLQQAQKMESIGTLAGGIAHDFNNILSSIIGYTELVLDNVDPGSTNHEHLKEVLHAGERAAKLVRQILTFSRQGNRERKPVQLDTIVGEALELLRASLPSYIEIREHIRTGPCIVLANATQVHQVVMNLCTNALHAMHNRNGVLEITLEKITLDGDGSPELIDLKPGSYMRLVVADTGDGIPPGIRDRIFDPYFTTKGKEKGTGLGLSVVHGIVRGHGGGITVDSTMGRGSIFAVYLPVIEKRAGRKAPVVSGEIPRGGERVLMVDDEEPIARLQRRSLERLGYHVTTRTGGLEALEAFRADPGGFDLVITDMAMPHMPGDLLAMEIKQIRPDLPVILCTGFSEKITPEDAAAIGVDGYLMKPVARKEMAETIRGILEKYKQANEEQKRGASNNERRMKDES